MGSPFDGKRIIFRKSQREWDHMMCPICHTFGVIFTFGLPFDKQPYTCGKCGHVLTEDEVRDNEENN